MQLSGLLCRVIARAFFYDHEAIGYSPRGPERKLCDQLVEKGYLRKEVHGRRTYFLPAAWLNRKFNPFNGGAEG